MDARQQGTGATLPEEHLSRPPHRARQGLVIFVPEGDPDDETRRPKYYDGTYEYLKSLGLREI